ncbi:hypothetical protein F0344_33935 [Streptomyces finlayi]|uniref:Uncharacterized protein n=1 Tax=Streptomyces finlayi TaxID=67296 RepID=A0A7G7BUB2_9ACTN|nr:hypothetical protein [Streptomyces finlayi]QNE78927.1 hypothetical protein F0344_33935 [Streptomyces finlayi]
MADRLEDIDLKSVQSTYAERFAADLVANRSEQGEVTAQIAQLQTRLEQLKKDEGWLAGMQGSLPTAAPTAPAAASDESADPAPTTGTKPDAKAVPQPRSAKGTRAKSAQPKTAQPKAAAKSTARKSAKKASGESTVAKKVAEEAAPKTAEAPLHQLLREFLPAGEPRLVREVHADLEKVYPDRKTSAQVVRNSLETLVKRGVISKAIQKGSAMYTAPKPDTEARATDVEVSAKA